MRHEIELGMKTARNSFTVHFIVQNKNFNLKNYLLYMGFEPRTFTLSFLRSTNSPMAD